jgi:hypothetical protein
MAHEDFYARNKISLFGLANVSSPSRLLDNRSRETILRNAFLHFRTVRKWRGMELWSWVGAMTGHGSGYSQQICEELGWNYAMKIGPNATLPRSE